MIYSGGSFSPPRPVALGRLGLRHPGRTTHLPTVTLYVGITAGCLTQAAPCSQPSQGSMRVTKEWLPLVLRALLGGHAHFWTLGLKSTSGGLEIFENVAKQEVLAGGLSGRALCPLADQGQDWGTCCPWTGTALAVISSCWYLPRLRSTAICGPCWLQEHESMLMGSGALVGGRGPHPSPPPAHRLGLSWPTCPQCGHSPITKAVPSLHTLTSPHLTSSPWPAQSWRASALIPGLAGIGGEGNGTPLQYSCLENPMGRGACRLQSMGSRRVRHD